MLVSLFIIGLILLAEIAIHYFKKKPHLVTKHHYKFKKSTRFQASVIIPYALTIGGIILLEWVYTHFNIIDRGYFVVIVTLMVIASFIMQLINFNKYSK